MEIMFETAHLRVRQFESEDALSLYKNHDEAEVKKWIPNESYADLEEAQNAIKFYIRCVSRKQLPYVLAVELKETGELIGDTGANQVEGILQKWESDIQSAKNTAEKVMPQNW